MIDKKTENRIESNVNIAIESALQKTNEELSPDAGSDAIMQELIHEKNLSSTAQIDEPDKSKE